MGYGTHVRARVARGVSWARAAACIVALPAALGSMPAAASDDPVAPAAVGVPAPDGLPDEARYVSREVPDIAIRTPAGE